MSPVRAAIRTRSECVEVDRNSALDRWRGIRAGRLAPMEPQNGAEGPAVTNLVEESSS